LRAGQRWRFTLRLRQPHGSMNPHGFDYEMQLFEQGVRATGSVRDAPAPELLQRAAGFPVERLRQRVRDAIEAGVPNRRAAGVLAALSIGDQGAIERLVSFKTVLVQMGPSIPGISGVTSENSDKGVLNSALSEKAKSDKGVLISRTTL
jgi:hypothetical protein